MAFDEPGLLGRDIYFVVRSDGYKVLPTQPGAMLPGTPTSEPGILLSTRSGYQATILLNRTQHAQRMYRLTGGGLYRDTLLVGGTAPIIEPLLSSAGVLGQDSLMAAPYKGRVFWFFGDTECPAGPRDTDCQHYGRFTTGATSPLAAKPNGTDPPSLSYFSSSNASDPGGMAPNGQPNATLLKVWNPGAFGHPRPMLAGPERDPRFDLSTWVGSLTVLRDPSTDEERMYLTYVCPTGGPDTIYGLARWDDVTEAFRALPGAARRMRYSGAQAAQRTQPAVDGAYVYYASPFAMARAPATFEGIEESSAYEYYTPCAAVDAGGCAAPAGRALNGSAWGWKRANLDGKPGGVAYFGPAEEAAMIKAGALAPAAARMRVVDAATAKPIGGVLSRGSVNWNAFRGVYVLIADRTDDTETDRTSRFGEIFYCEAAAITGPWRDCHKVVTHEATGTSCYNPLQLPWLDEGGGRTVYLACTFTSMSSSKSGKQDRACTFDGYGGVDCAIAVPRYEYNNLVFRLDVESVAKGWADA